MPDEVATPPTTPDHYTLGASKLVLRSFCCVGLLSFSPPQMPLTYDRGARELMSPVGVAFPISTTGIPNMVPACARILPEKHEEGGQG